MIILANSAGFCFGVKNAVEGLEKEAQKAQEQRAKQIEIMNAQLEYQRDSGEFWADVQKILDSAFNSDGSLNNNSALVALLKQDEAFGGLSEMGKEKWIDELVEEFITGMNGFEEWKMDKAKNSIATHKDDNIVLKVNDEYRSISVSKIYYCEAEDKYQRFYFENGERLLIRISGTELYRQLSEFGSFYHCGRAHIINLNHISRVTQSGAEFKNGMQLSLPHTVLAGLRSAFFDYFN